MKYILAVVMTVVLLLITAVLPEHAALARRAGAALASVQPARACTACQAAPSAREHQYIAGVILRQNTGQVRVTIGVVDLGPSRKYTTKLFQQGVLIRDDAGRQVGLQGKAKLLRQGRTFQVFQLYGAKLVRRATMVRVTHLSVGVFSGDDWEHWYDSGYVCASPQMPLEDCLEMWR